MDKTDGRLALLMDFENLIIGLENSDPTAEKPFSISAILRYLESNFGQVIYRKAFADWSNAKFRKYAFDLSRAGVEMQHVIRSGSQSKNAADTHLVIQAMDCMLHYPLIDTYVIVTGDGDFLPLITKLKAGGKKVFGLGTQGTTANSLVENCDEYLYCSNKGLTPKSRLPADIVPVPRNNRNGEEKKLVATVVSGDPAFADYMRASRWFIQSAPHRDRIIQGIYEQSVKGGEPLTLAQLREQVPDADNVSDKEWFGTLFSLIHGGCLWEDPTTSEKPLYQRGVSLYRGIRDSAEFFTRYYCSLFHKAYSERPSMTARDCCDLMYGATAPEHLAVFEKVMERLSERQ